MPKGRIIGVGRTAEVYEWEDGWVLKLYRESCPRDWVRHDAEMGRAAHQAGLPAPAVRELVELDGRLGYVCERVTGPSLLDRLKPRPWRAGAVGRTVAGLHHRIHGARVPSTLPRLRERLAWAVREVGAVLGDDTGRVLAAIQALPDGAAMCHYDLHPGNVLGDGDGVRIIDWLTAGIGPPAVDVARSLLLLDTPFLPPGFPTWLRPLARGVRRRLASAYRAEYLRLSGLAPAEIEAWRVPVAAARLWEKVDGEREWLLEIVRRGLASSAPSPAPARSAPPA